MVSDPEFAHMVWRKGPLNYSQIGKLNHDDPPRTLAGYPIFDLHKWTNETLDEEANG